MKARYLLLVGLITAAGCQPARGTHESVLSLEHSGRNVVPSFARDRSGTPFSGRAYGTLFGETSMDCVEWEGTFAAGHPEGEFLIYKNCGGQPIKVWFAHGVRVTASISSFKQNPLRAPDQLTRQAPGKALA